MEEKKNYKAADMMRDNDGRLHVGEQDDTRVEEITNMDLALEVNTAEQDVQFEPQPVHAVDNNKEENKNKSNEEKDEI
jgi:hypothetical protein